MAETKKVLFLCTGNSVRSQMAEGLLNTLGAEDWKAQSAGIISSYVHPLAIQVMEEIGMDISKKTSKSMDRFIKQRFDYVITLCDDADRFCSNFGFQGKKLHWPFEDPAGATGTSEERLTIFRRIRDGIKRKIEEFLKSEASGIPSAIASFKF
jgi:arsenate reductase